MTAEVARFFHVLLLDRVKRCPSVQHYSLRQEELLWGTADSGQTRE